MTVLEELAQAEQRLIARVRELEPLVREHAELAAELKRRGLSTSTAEAPATKPAASTRTPRASRNTNGSKRSRRSSEAKAAAAAPAASTGPSSEATTVSSDAATPAKKTRPSRAKSTKPKTGAKRPGSSRAPRGGRAEQIQNLVSQNPGVTVSDLGKKLGVEANGLYQPVRKLVASGALRKDGLQLHPVASAG